MQGIGEPPLLLGMTVYHAVADAIKSYRQDQGYEGHFTLDGPATAERILVACMQK